MMTTKSTKIGSTFKEHQGDWEITWECIGFNRFGHAMWEEKRRKWSPSPTLAAAMASIDRDRDMQYTRNMHQIINRR